MCTGKAENRGCGCRRFARSFPLGGEGGGEMKFWFVFMFVLASRGIRRFTVVEQEGGASHLAIPHCTVEPISG